MLTGAAKHTLVVLTVLSVSVVTASCDGREGGLGFGINARQHEPFFPIETGKHALGFAAFDGAISCDSCHAGSTTFKEPSCIGCHEHAADTTNAAHAGLSDYRYASPSCLTCHPRGEPSLELTSAQHDEYFPIDDASAHAPVRCAECHTSTADREVVTCTGCHDHDAAPMQVVHGTMPGYQWDTASCRSCHARAENPGAFDHAAYFPTSTGTVHEAIACVDCHASRSDRTQAACITCHAHEPEETDGQHVGVPEYAYDSGSCKLCHAQAQVPGILAHTFFPIEPGQTHALGSTTVDTPPVTIECATCHQNEESRADTTCLACHAHSEDQLAPTHADIPGYQWTSASCLFCHPGGEPQGLIDHVFFPIADGDVHNAAAVSCNQCHASATNRSLLACTSCHEHRLEVTEPPHRGMPGFAFDSAACVTCHAQAQVPGVFDHEPFFPTAAPSVHTGFTCADCHASQTNRTQIACTSCHLGEHDQAPMDATHQGIPDYSWTPASCLGCHPNGTAAGAVFGHPFFPIAAPSTHSAFSCVDCHTTPGDNTRVECTSCHTGAHDAQPMTATHTNVPGYEHATAACLLCHPNGEPQGTIDHDGFFPIAAPAVHQGIACVDCHVNANDNSLVGCAQCHANDAVPPATVHAGIGGFVNESSACLSCHPRGEPGGLFDHVPFFPIASGTVHQPIGCSECHASTTNRAQTLCAECHASVPPALTTSHAPMRGFVNTSTGCKQCHAEAQVDRASAHTPFRIASGDHRQPCLDCHTSTRADKPWAADFARTSCVECHSVNEMNGHHLGEINGYVSYDVPRCTSCHPDGQKP